jgi:hypothetical protein
MTNKLNLTAEIPQNPQSFPHFLLNWIYTINFANDHEYQRFFFKMKMLQKLLIVLMLWLSGALPLVAQQFPGEDENIPYLITFGKDGLTSWGDDDFSQTFFISMPLTQKDPIYIRVFDPNIGGELDEMKGDFNTRCKFSVYGGPEAYSHPNAQGYNPEGKYDSGVLLATKTFDADSKYDQQWFTFGPFNPGEGERVEAQQKYIFKVIAEGISGDDGNIYKYFVSTRASENLPVEGANAFTYEYTFRMPNERFSICHIYPFIDDAVVSIQQHNFDWDNDGTIRIVSIARKGEQVDMSGDNNWRMSKHNISDREKNKSLDIQFVKSNSTNNNNVVVRVTNQYGEAMPFFSIPIGGKPVYEPLITATPIKR